jgi:hypothetical protein
MFRQDPPAWAWIYLGLRATVATLPGLVARRLAPDLNKIENKSTESRSMRAKAKKLWRSLPATLSTNYWLFYSFVLLHGVSVLVVVRKTKTIGQSWDTLKSEWGQSANAIIAVCAICHVAYTLTRLFTAESMHGRAKDDENNGLSTSWVFPMQPLLTLRPWNTLSQRWPFGLRLDFPDHLVVDESTLQSVLKPLPEEDPKVREKLWEELMDGFTWNDPEGILDCLIQGAPTDRPNTTGDYPIHLASRTNDTNILMRTRFKRQEDSGTVDSLLFMNSASEIPLEIACNANKLEAVRWIIERMPQEQDEAKAAIGRVFRSSIDTENLDVLKILVHLWPAWKALRLGTEATEYSPFYYAVAKHKEKAANLLLNPKINQTKDPELWRSYELARMAALPDVMRCILRHNQDKLSTKTTENLTYDVLECRLGEDEIWELLQALSIDVRYILFGDVVSARQEIRDSIPFQKPELWKNLVAEVSKHDTVLLDSLLLRFASRGERNRRSDDHPKENDQVVATLMHHGALDWSKEMEASMLGEFDDLKRLVKAEADSVSLGRMLNAQDQMGVSILSHVISRSKRSLLEDVIDTVDFLLKHGSLVTSEVLMRTCSSIYSTDSLIVFRMMLFAEQKKGVASDALHKLCKRSNYECLDWPEQGRQIYSMLLRSGANPTLKNKDGKTPRENFDEAPGSRWERNGHTKASALLRRWENFYRDPSSGNPSDQPDQDWVEVHDRVVRIAGEHRWASLVEKNPCFRVIDADTTRKGIWRREIERAKIKRREFERREIKRRETTRRETTRRETTRRETTRREIEKRKIERRDIEERDIEEREIEEREIEEREIEEREIEEREIERREIKRRKIERTKIERREMGAISEIEETRERREI